MSTKGWIGVDLDGTLAEYNGWQGAGHIGTPIPAMVERVKAWLDAGIEVRIVTARVSYPPYPSQGSANHSGREALERIRQAMEARRAIRRWTEEVFGQQLAATNEKDHGMIELWDDRAVAVERNTGRILGHPVSGHL